MKYNGIIITDSMAMSAIANLYSSDEAAVKATQVGCDMILMPYQLESAINGIETAVNSGDITEERIEESGLISGRSCAKTVFATKDRTQIKNKTRFIFNYL